MLGMTPIIKMVVGTKHTGKMGVPHNSMTVGITKGNVIQKKRSVEMKAETMVAKAVEIMQVMVVTVVAEEAAVTAVVVVDGAR